MYNYNEEPKMKLENQVCSLESAKKLKELGVEQNSLLYWEYCNRFNKWQIEYDIFDGDKGMRGEGDVSAFTVAELGEMLPKHIDKHGWRHHFQILHLSDKFWEVSYVNNECIVKHILSETEAEARAKILIYLYENKLIKGIGNEHTK